MPEPFHDLFGILNEVADDAEADVLETLGLRCGYLWKCETNDEDTNDE